MAVDYVEAALFVMNGATFMMVLYLFKDYMRRMNLLKKGSHISK